MGAVVIHAISGLRNKWRSWFGLALLVALAGGSVLALGVGARRTNTAYPRFLSTERAADVQVFLNDPTLAVPVEGLPEVAESALALVIFPTSTDFAPIVLLDGRLGQEVNRFKILAGRPLRPDRDNEAVLSFLVARRLNLRVGSTLTAHFLVGTPSGSPEGRPAPSEASPATQAVSFRVVGIEAAPGEFPPRSATFNLPVYLSPAFLRTPVGARAQQTEGSVKELVVRLRRGAEDVPAFLAGVERLSGGPANSIVFADQSAGVQRSLHLQAVALGLMAGFAALTTALILFQLLVRQSAEDAADDTALRALGMTSGQLLGSGMLRVGAMALAGATGATILATALSPLLPLGTARIAEPHPGFAVDVTALGLGAAGVLMLVGLLGAVALLRTTKSYGGAVNEPVRSLRPSSVGNVLGRSGAPVVVTTGVRLALQPGRGRSAVPVRATVTSAAVGVAALAAALVFGASLTHLLATPGLYGATFDADVQSAGTSSEVGQLVPALRADPAVAALAVATAGIPLEARRVRFGAVATTTVEGTLDPVVIEGRLPTGPDEILLGSRTLNDLGARLGQTIEVTASFLTRPVTMKIVGRGVLAAVVDNEQLGQGGVITPGALTVFADLAQPGFSLPPPGSVYVRFKPGTAKEQAIADLSDKLGGPGVVFVYRPTVPSDVANFGQVRNLPEILAGLLGLVAAAAMAHLLVTGLRRRRRDLAVLKTLGLVPHQVSAVIAWQATTLALFAVVLGVPIGLAAGRTLWAAVAAQVGVVVQPQVPSLPLALLVPATMLVANLVAAGPAIVAGRVRPAIVLRSE